MILSPKQLREKISTSDTLQEAIKDYRATITRILQGEDPRILLIVGPCSIHHLENAKRYAMKLKKLASEVEDDFFIIMRAYVEKSRTNYNWFGLLSDPHLDGSNDIEEGLHLTRQLLIDLAEIGIPAGTEFVNPFTIPYFEDLISWGSIGARTAQSQIHRQLASDLAMPIGFKNTTDGNIANAVYGAACAQKSHTMLTIDHEGKIIKKKTKGNMMPHIVLRGGESESNCNKTAIESALNLLAKEGLSEVVLIDCAHGNCQRNPELQKSVFTFAVDELIPTTPSIRGLMLESYLQEHSSDASLTSITDPCLDWNTTEVLIRYAAKTMRREKSSFEKLIASKAR